MKIILAPDKYKNSLNGFEFCEAVEKGILKAYPKATILKIPLADGGDGTMEVIHHYLNGNKITLEVNDPLFRKIKATYLYSKKQKIAFIEMGEASGLKLLTVDERNCMHTTSFGTGEMILDAIKRGAEGIFLGIGGSATNDCGIGMANALGYTFLNENNEEIVPIGKNLSKIKKIDTSAVHSSIKMVSFKVACDVTNPLCGNNGAAYMYGAQKGANAKDIVFLDKGLQDFSKVLKDHFDFSIQCLKGAGAAGGMGAGAKLFLNATLVSGIEFVLEIANFSKKIENADWIITGEGKLDAQTLSGKTIAGILMHSKKQNIPVAALCGSVSISIEEQEQLGLDYIVSIVKEPESLESAMENAYENLIFASYNFIKNLI